MKVIPLPSATIIGTGFTHKVILSYTDLQALANGGVIAKVFPEGASTIPVGWAIHRIAISVKTGFVHDSTLTCAVGDNTTADRYISATNIKLVAGQVVSAVPFAYGATSKYVQLTFATGAGEVNAVTAGEMEIYLAVSDYNALRLVE